MRFSAFRAPCRGRSGSASEPQSVRKIAVLEYADGPSVSRRSCYGKVFRPDHEVRVHRTVRVDPRLQELFGAFRISVFDAGGVCLAVSEVAGRVLVEQGVVEQDP